MIPADTADRLVKLLPRLASEHDGEVVATARAIGRTLAAAGMDWHALAAAVTGKGSAAPFDFDAWTRNAAASRPRPEPKPRPAPDAPEAPANKSGYPLWGTSRSEPWCVVAQHCLQLDWTIPKASGGKFLTKAERDRLKRLAGQWGLVTNADAGWLEGIITRCHAARDRWRSAKQTAAA